MSKAEIGAESVQRTELDLVKAFNEACNRGDADLCELILTSHVDKVVTVNGEPMLYSDVKKELRERYKEFVENKRKNIPQTSTELLPLEMEFGAYEDFDQEPDDALTPHHMPANKYMDETFHIPFDNSWAMNLEQPNKGGRHRRTYSYGMVGMKQKLYMALDAEDALKFDVVDTIRVLKEDGLYDAKAKEKLKKYVEEYTKKEFINSKGNKVKPFSKTPKIDFDKFDDIDVNDIDAFCGALF